MAGETRKPPLPPRLTPCVAPVDKTIRLSDIHEIDDNVDYHIQISMNDTVFDHDLFNKLLNKRRTILEFLDYESLKYFDQMLTGPINVLVYLVDDGELKDRSYIDVTSIKNMNVSIPINYLMWNPKLGDKTIVYEYRKSFPTNTNYCFQDNRVISSDDLRKIRDLVIRLERLNPKDDVEKVYMVSDYIQSTLQYIDGQETLCSKGVIVCPEFEPMTRVQHQITSALNKGFGVCGAMSHLSTLLLNNDVMNVETETVRGEDHFWNRVLIDGKYYYVDNTWNITRSKNSPEDALITYGFNDEYLLFGTDTAKKIGHHEQTSTNTYNNGVDSIDDYSKISYDSSFEYMTKPKYKTYKK